MKLAIDKNVPIPAYQQVVDGVAGAIARGDLDIGARLPSVRNFAVDLGLNVNTVARAYRDLERAGVIQTMPGMGTFVAENVPPPDTWPTSRPVSLSEAGARAVAGSPTGSASAKVPVSSSSWRELLSAAYTVALADGLSDEDFLAEAADATRNGALRASTLVVGLSASEAADLLRTLPAEVAAGARAIPIDDLSQEARQGSVTRILTTFPAQGRVRERLDGLSIEVPLVPAESELTEQAVRALADLAPNIRIALVTVEKDNWDYEANDVMKIVGRNRWLKMVLIENGERGLEQRLATVDAVLVVPRALSAIEPYRRDGLEIIELTRQITPRTAERLADTATGC